MLCAHPSVNQLHLVPSKHTNTFDSPLVPFIHGHAPWGNAGGGGNGGNGADGGSNGDGGGGSVQHPSHTPVQSMACVTRATWAHERESSDLHCRNSEPVPQRASQDAGGGGGEGGSGSVGGNGGDICRFKYVLKIPAAEEATL